MRIGKKQLQLLIMMASPTMILVTTDRISDSLVKRGLFSEERGKVCRITPNGLRVLADYMAAGQVEVAILAMRIDAAARKKKLANKTLGPRR